MENSTTKDNLKAWEETLSSKEEIENIQKIIIENKCDLLGDENKYNDDINNLRRFSKQLGCKNFFRTSAKNGYNVNEAIDYLINEIIKEIKEVDIECCELKKRDTLHIKGEKSKTKVRCC